MEPGGTQALGGAFVRYYLQNYVILFIVSDILARRYRYALVNKPGPAPPMVPGSGGEWAVLQRVQNYPTPSEPASVAR